MKTLYKMMIVAACSLSFTGCYDLDCFPEDKLSSGTFWKNQQHADMGMMGVYSVLQYDDAMGRYFALDCMTDIGYANSDYVYSSIARGTTNARSSVYKNRWKNLYEGVTRSNTALQNIPATDMSDEQKAKYMAEAKFLRSFYYFQLLDLFGGVPLYDEATIVSNEFNNMKKPRSTADDTRKFILDDLEAAINSLPDKWDEANYGRATRGAAYALKGKVLLFNKQYADAEKCFEAISGANAATYGYELYDNYADIFTPAGDESGEMVFAIQNKGGKGEDYGMPMAWYLGTRSTFNGNGWNSSTMATEFVATYEHKTDGKPLDWDVDICAGMSGDDDLKKEVFISEMSKDGTEVASYTSYRQQLLALWDDLDPRLAATVILPYTTYDGWIKNAPKLCEYVVAEGNPLAQNGFLQADNSKTKNYFWRKFVPEGNLNGELNNRADTPINFPIIRYADVLLMLAECYNETGNGDPIALINQVRARQSVNMPAINSGSSYLAATSKAEIFERIKHERAVEFAGEGLRFSDLKRWGLLETMNGVAKKSMLGGQFYKHVASKRDYLWPIPGDEKDKNPDLEQNPGW